MTRPSDRPEWRTTARARATRRDIATGMVIVARFRGRAAVRRAVRALRTARGTMTVLMGGVGASSFGALLFRPSSHDAMTAAARAYAIRFSELPLLTAVAFGMLALLIREVLILPPREPLSACPTALPALAGSRLLGEGLPFIGVGMLLMHGVFLGRILYHDLDGDLAALALYAAAQLPVVLTAGIAASALFRTLFVRRRVTRHIAATHHVTTIGMLASMAAMPATLAVLGPNAVRALSGIAGRLGALAALGPMLNPAYAAARAWHHGNGWSAGAIALLPVAVFMVVVKRVLDWLPYAPMELTADVALRDRAAHFASMFARMTASTAGARTGGTRGLELFARKDVLAPLTRRPLANALANGLLCSVTVGILVLVRHGILAGALPPWCSLAAAHAAIGVAAAAVAARAGIACLGRDGPDIGIIRTLVPARALLWWKSAPVVAFAIAAGAAHGVFATIVGRLLAMPLTPSLGAAASFGAVSGAGSAALACALGFLLPDVHRRTVALPGASRWALGLYTGLAGYAVAATVVADGLADRAAVAGGFTASVSAVLAIAAASVLLAVAAFAPRRLASLSLD